MENKVRIVDNFIKEMNPNLTVLDMGCGSGKTLKKLFSSGKNFSLVSVDMNEASDEIKKISQFQKMSVEEVGQRFSESQFDVIFCQHVLEHLLYPTTTVGGIRSTLKKNGYLFLEVPTWIRAYNPFYRNFFWNDYTHVRPFTKITLKKLLKDYSFKIERIYEFSSIGREGTLLHPRNFLKYVATLFFKDTIIIIARNEK